MSQKVAEEKVSYGWDLQPIDCLQINFSYLETSLCSTPPPPPLAPNNNLLSPAHKQKPTCLGGGQDIIQSLKYEVQIVKIPFCDQLVSDEVCSKMLQKLNCTMTENMFENELNLRLVSNRRVMQEIW